MNHCSTWSLSPGLEKLFMQLTETKHAVLSKNAEVRAFGVKGVKASLEALQVLQGHNTNFALLSFESASCMDPV